MGLADDLAEPDDPWAQRCQVTKLLDQLDPDDAEALRGALANPDLTAAFIERKLQANGYKASAYTIRRHRNGVCCKEAR